MIDKNLLGILACPKCKGDIIYINEGFVCLNCKLLFKMEEDIPNFIIDEAVELNNGRIEKIKQNYENI